jgi:hypothetical protein
VKATTATTSLDVNKTPLVGVVAAACGEDPTAGIMFHHTELVLIIFSSNFELGMLNMLSQLVNLCSLCLLVLCENFVGCLISMCQTVFWWLSLTECNQRDLSLAIFSNTR